MKRSEHDRIACMYVKFSSAAREQQLLAIEQKYVTQEKKRNIDKMKHEALAIDNDMILNVD